MSDSGIYKEVYDEIADALAIHDIDTGVIEQVNTAYAKRLARTTEGLRGKSLQALSTAVGEGDQERIQRVFQTAAQGESQQCDCAFAFEGERRQVTVSFERVTLADEPKVVSRVSERKEEPDPPEQSRHQALEETKRRLELALSATNTGIWEWHLDSDEIVWTETMERLVGLEPGDFGGTLEEFSALVHPDDLPAVERQLKAAVEQNTSYEAEFRFEGPDGEWMWLAVAGQLVTDGEAGRMIGVCTDITERKVGEEALQRREQQYRQLVERLPEAYCTVDDDWQIQLCNEVLSDRWGVQREEIRGAHLWTAYPEFTGGVVEETLRTVKNTGEPASCEYHSEQHGYWAELHVYPYEGGVAVISTDITDRKQNIETLLDVAPVVLYRMDANGVIEESRGRALSKLGLERNELVGVSVFEAYEHNDDVVDSVRRALDGEECRVKTEIGGLTMETQYTPLIEDCEVVGLIGIAIDVTELERQREQMEFFNSILRHDVLNGMTVIKIRGELLAEQLDGEQAEYAETIVEWCDQVTEITGRVQRVIETLTTPEEEHSLEPTDPASILERKTNELASAYPAVEFRTALSGSALVEADELLADVLGNLLSNSIEHSDTPDLTIETGIEYNDETVRILVTDNGTGVSDDRKESIFRRGETSHAKESGSGFGLFFADVMVEKYGGSIWVEDSEAGGARFVVELPRANQ